MRLEFTANCTERDILQNVKFSAPLNKISIVVFHDRQKIQHTITCVDLSIENPTEDVPHKLS